MPLPPGEFPRELLGKHGIAYELAKQTKSELFRDLLPLLNSGRIVLPPNDRLKGQIVAPETVFRHGTEGPEGRPVNSGYDDRSPARFWIHRPRPRARSAAAPIAT